jgi:hypothetical protein
MHSTGALNWRRQLQITPFSDTRNFPIVLFDIHEGVGFEKFDILSQRHWSY